MKKHVCRLFVTTPIGLVLIAVGIIVWFTVNTAIHNTLDDSAVTLPENDKNDLVNPWTRFIGNKGDENNQRVYSYYVFNLTNPTETTQGELPIFEELGPYNYQYIYQRINYNISEDEDTVSFQMWKQYVPIIPEEGDNSSRNPLTDEVFHFNLAYAAIIKQVGGEVFLGFQLSAGAVAQIKTSLSSASFTELVAAAFTPSVLTGIQAQLAANTYSIWVSPTPVAGPPPTFNAGQFGVDATVTSAMFTALMTPTAPLSFTNTDQTNGFGVWYLAQTNSNVKASLKAGIISGYGIPEPMFDPIFAWYTNFRNTTSIPVGLKASVPYCQLAYTCTAADVPYLQWCLSTGLLNGISVSALQPLPGVPEFGIHQNHTLSLDAAKALLSAGSPLSLLTATGTGTLFGLLKTGNDTFIKQQTGNLLGLADLAQLVPYSQYIQKTFAWPTIIAGNGGPFPKHTVNDYIFNSEDPLLKLLFPTDPSKWNSAPLSNIPDEETATAELPVDTTYTGHNDSLLSQVPVTYHGHETVQYAIPIKVEGHNSENIGPFFLADAEVEDPAVVLFSDEYARSLFMVREVVGNLGGLRYYRYRMDESNWAINETLFTTIDHLMNLTSPMGIPVYFSRPRLKGLNVAYFTKAGLSDMAYDTEDNDVYGDYEPFTGKAIRGRYSLQVNYYVDGEDGATSPLFNYFTNLQADVIYPMVWGKNEVEATQEQIDLIGTGYKVDALRYALTTILIVIGSFLVICAGGLYLIDSLIEKGFFTDN